MAEQQALTTRKSPQIELYEKMASQELTMQMSNDNHVDPMHFVNTVWTVAFPKEKPNAGQFLAFLMTAQQYRLNPILKQIHAFPTQEGGLIPVLSVDGWIQLVQSNPKYNGVKFRYHWSDSSNTEVPKEEKAHLVAITTLLRVKGQDEPTEVTEFMSECRRETKPWKSHPSRMLRHKSYIQCARVALGISGVYDEDEADRIYEDSKTIEGQPSSGKAATATDKNTEKLKERIAAAKEPKPEFTADVAPEPTVAPPETPEPSVPSPEPQQALETPFTPQEPASQPEVLPAEPVKVMDVNNLPFEQDVCGGVFVKGVNKNSKTPGGHRFAVVTFADSQGHETDLFCFNTKMNWPARGTACKYVFGEQKSPDDPETKRFTFEGFVTIDGKPTDKYGNLI